MPVHIGDRAITRTPFRPTGRVEVEGQLYDARSEREFIDANVPCLIIRGEFRNLIVRELLSDEPVPELPNMGQELIRHIFDQTAQEVAEAHKRSENERMAPWQRWTAGIIAAVSLGGAFGIATSTMAWLLGKLGEQGNDPRHVALILGGTTAVGIGWALFLFMVQYVIMPIVSIIFLMLDLGEEQLRPSFIVVFCAMVGSVIGAWPSEPGMRWQELLTPGLIGAGVSFVGGLFIAGTVQSAMRRRQ